MKTILIAGISVIGFLLLSLSFLKRRVHASIQGVEVLKTSSKFVKVRIGIKITSPVKIKMKGTIEVLKDNNGKNQVIAIAKDQEIRIGNGLTMLTVSLFYANITDDVLVRVPLPLGSSMLLRAKLSSIINEANGKS